MASLVYLHGFLSSPSSAKAQITKAWLNTHYPQHEFVCPLLPSEPRKAKPFLDELFQSNKLQQDVALIGSSLGGFWATYIAEQKGFPAVLVNPAVSPQKRFCHWLGNPMKHYYSDDICVLEASDIDVMEQCDPPSLANPQQYWLMAQTGDEVLDYTLAEERYRGAKQTIEEGGNHSFEGFEAFLPEIWAFMQPRLGLKK